MATAIQVGSRVECEDCNGRHKGTVVMNLGRRWWGVAWDDRNDEYGQPGNTDPHFPDHFLAAHKHALVSIGELAIRPTA